MLVLPVSPNSKFDMHLLQQHIREASVYVSECKKQNKDVFDVCGERGDLYFLLNACLLEGKKTLNCQINEAWCEGLQH